MTFFIVLITISISVLAFASPQISRGFVFSPYRVNNYGEWYRFLTSGFIHADWIHLLVNMLVLYFLGGYVEFDYSQVFGNKSWYCFLILYLGAILIAVLPTYLREKDNPSYTALGASGAVSAVLFVFIIFNPLEKLYLYGILGIPGIVLGPAYLIYSYFMNKRGQSNINHDAHFWGAIFGVVYTFALKPSLMHYFFEKIFVI